MEAIIMAKTLAELSAQAEKLYSDFVDSYKDYTQTHNIEDMDDLIPDEYEFDPEYVASRSGHCDEQILENYWDAMDDDGNYVHPLGKIEW